MRFFLSLCSFIVVFALITISSLSEAWAAPVTEDLLRVRLKSQENEVSISGTSLRFQGSHDFFKPVTIPQNESLQVKRFVKNGHSFWLLTRRNKSQILSTPFIAIEGQNMRIGAQTLSKRIFLAASGAQKMDVIGVVPLEEYIAGVIASEMPLQWPIETLKAQAVAARSYALSVMKERSRKVYHLESSILDQVFKPLVSEGQETPLVRKARQAVRETRGQILKNPKGQLLKAFYHSDCGGKTVAATNVWKGSASAGEVTDSACPLRPGSQWTLNKSKSEVYQNLKKFMVTEKSAEKSDEILSLSFLKEADGQRVSQVQVHLSSGVTKLISSNDFRGAVGFQVLRSTYFEASEAGQDIVFKGQGYGHGVGLCQWGSRHLGMNGAKYTEILKHYYPLAQISPATREGLSRLN